MATINQYRLEVAHLARLAESDLAALWRQVSNADISRERLARILPELVSVYGSAAGALAADWYDEARDEAGVRGRFTAIVADLPDVGRTDALAGWAVGPLFRSSPDNDAALRMAQGGLQRIVADAGRDTIAGSSVADPHARGWQRTGTGECDFCQMLIDRGAVYTEATADFLSHDRCNCAAEPAWS